MVFDMSAHSGMNSSLEDRAPQQQHGPSPSSEPAKQWRTEILPGLPVAMKHVEIEMSPRFERHVWCRLYDCDHRAC